jgi:alkylation response protein AidB-like acyl-CoA dehydrogenase
MTITRDDLLAMAATLRKALGSDAQMGAGALMGPGTRRDGPDRGWRARWPDLAELGLAGFCVAEDCEGFGNEVPAALMAARELGAALHGSPYPGMVAASYALTRWLADEQRQQVAEAVTSGAHVPTLAYLAPGAVMTVPHDNLRVTGRAHLVAGAASANSFLALLPPDSALPPGYALPRGHAVPHGQDLLLLILRDGACTVTRTDEFDVTRDIGDVDFSGATAVPLTVPPGGRALVERLHGLLLAGDALGGLSRMLDRTVGYAAQRTTFGTAIGGYQAVQHRLVDHTIALRGMSLLADEAAKLLAAGAPGADRAVLLAEASVAAGGLPLLHDLVQLTGAIGFTWEYGLHLYERRAHLDARLGRNPRRARRLLAEQAGWVTGAGQGDPDAS